MKQLTSYNRVAGYLNKIFDLLNACPSCGMSVRATRTVRIACMDCNEQMLEV